MTRLIIMLASFLAEGAVGAVEPDDEDAGRGFHAADRVRAVREGRFPFPEGSPGRAAAGPAGPTPAVGYGYGYGYGYG